MKIVTWNCNGAFRKKHEALDEFDADLLVIQECEDPNQSTKNFAEWSGGYLWTGKSKNKGLGVFPRKSSKLEKLDWPDENLEQFLPCRVNDSFNLLAVWTKQADSTTFQYIGQFWKYLQLNKESISGPKTVICGDFNSNSCWDKRGRHWNHSDVVRELEELGILSMYHEMSGVDQGKEEVPTIFHMKNKEKPYHIDYAFVSSPLMHAGNLDVGHPDQWLEFSDHMPVVFHLPDLGGSDHRPSNVTRDLLRKKVWEVLPKYENEYSLDEEDSGSDYTSSAIMKLWERGLAEGDDKRKAVLLLRKIMFHDRMNSESGNFEFIDDQEHLVETILKRLENTDSPQVQVRS